VSTTQAELVEKFAADVIDTGGKIVAGVVDNCNPHVISYVCKNKQINISYQRIFGISHRDFFIRGAL
jgi:hypothetical protein